jgi:dienelactone hydrolase
MAIFHISRLGLCYVLLLGITNALQAKLITQEVNYHEQSSNASLKGYFAYDDQFTANDKKIPGVLITPEWWGMDDYVCQRAQQLAALGYAAFVIDLYGNGQSTTNSRQATAWSHPFYADTGLMVSRA